MANESRPYERHVAPPAPSRAEVEERLRGVVDGWLSRDEADRWAMQWVAADNPQVEDRVVWEGLSRMLAGIDMPDASGGFLHDDAQVAAWLDAFRQECRQSPRSNG
jgi:hypothetical protein